MLVGEHTLSWGSLEDDYGDRYIRMHDMPDFYTKFREFAVQLGIAGFPTWASKLTDAIAAGSTGSEILMAVRWNLWELLRNEVDLPSALKQQAEGFIEEITSSGV